MFYKIKKKIDSIRKNKVNKQPQDTLKILKQGWFNINGQKIKLKLSKSDMKKVQVYLPNDVNQIAEQFDFDLLDVSGQCSYGASYCSSFSIARERIKDKFLYSKDDKEILVFNISNPIENGDCVKKDI